MCAVLLLLSVDCRDATVLPIGGGGGGDTGQNPPSTIVWHRLTTFPLRQVHSLAALDTVILAGCDSGYLYRSVDSGRSWTASTLPPFAGDIETIFLASSGVGYASSSSFGILRSRDGGISWISCTPPDTSVIALGVFDEARLVAGTMNGQCLISSDSGGTWSQEFSLGRPITCILPTSPTTALLATWGGGVFINTFGSSFLDTRNEGLLNPYLYVLAKTPTGRLLAGTWQGGIFKSTNDGGTWERWGDSLVTQEVVAVCEVSARVILAGTMKGPFVSTDAGLHWTGADSGYTARSVYCLKAAAGAGILAGSEDGLYRTPAAVSLPAGY